MSGFGIQVNDVLTSVSFVLLEKSMDTVLSAPVAAGVRTVTMVHPCLYVGAQIIVGNRGTVTEEIVTVSAITAADFTATFAQTHAAGESIRGATVPSGQINQLSSPNISTAAVVAPLFTQAELRGYCFDIENDFLERTRPVYTSGNVNLAIGNPIASAPADSIRIERADIQGTALWNASQSELDMSSPGSLVGSDTPTMWYQDKTNTGKFAVASAPPVNLVAELFYSQKRTAIPALTDFLVMPDICWLYLKYGVLATCFAKEGEMRDARRAAYCSKRYERGVQYVRMFMRQMQAQMDYSRLAEVGV